ncbi:MAG: prepilin-type N-terminal cleavage/methylation domain-containing protein [Nitrospirae bacterium]|nr:prepilin-type N-terminal cleavage/methylation domain-containing protein [Nitrospirota bacterium]
MGYREKYFTNKGFTLVEMMVVVAIIAILAAVGIPKFQKYVINAKSTEAASTMGEIADAMKAYWDTHGQYPANINGYGNGAEESHISGQTTKTGISDTFPTLDISSSMNWTYQVIAFNTVMNANNEIVGAFCITATAVNVSNSINGRAMYYVDIVWALNQSYASLMEGHFYKFPLFDESAPSVTTVTNQGCMPPSTT